MMNYPEIEFVRFRRTEFFPPKPDDLTRIYRICIGTKSRNLGDALVLTALPRRLKTAYPHLKVRTYPRAYNRVVFYNNPYVEGLSYIPSAVYGDDCEQGSGHVIQLKERFFDLEPSPVPKPELYLTRTEREEARLALARYLDRPLCFIHPFASPLTTLFDGSFWEQLVSRWKEKIHFIQVGILSHAKIPGCSDHFLFSSSVLEARKLFALMESANMFLGLDSGPMHVARAFEVPSLILTSERDPQKIFDLREEGVPYFFYHSRENAFLYRENLHYCPQAKPLAVTQRAMDDFLERAILLRPPRKNIFERL